MAKKVDESVAICWKSTKSQIGKDEDRFAFLAMRDRNLWVAFFTYRNHRIRINEEFEIRPNGRLAAAVFGAISVVFTSRLNKSQGTGCTLDGLGLQVPATDHGV